MAYTVAFSDLDTWLQNQPENTKDTPYEITITGLTTENYNRIKIVLSLHSMKYVDLSTTNIPSDVANMNSTFYRCATLVNAPAIPNGVTDISNAFEGCSSLVNAPVIPDSVTDMSGTFYNCSSLVNAPVIPDSVTDMNSTFYNCSSLVNAPVIPNGVTRMNVTFYRCTSLSYKPIIPSTVSSSRNCYQNVTTPNWKGTQSQAESFLTTFFAQTTDSELQIYNSNKVTYEESIYNIDISTLSTYLSGLSNNTKTTPYKVYIRGLTTSNASSIRTSLSRYADLSLTTIPNGTSCTQLFWYCSYLIKSPTLPTDATSLGSTFANCTNLTTPPTIPSGVTSMGSTFAYCESLTSAPVLPNGVQDLYMAFLNYPNITPPTIPSTVINIAWTFHGAKISTAPTIPNSVVYMINTFKDCTNLKTAPVIPEGVTNIVGCFCNSAIETVPYIPSTITNAGSSVDPGAFENCLSLRKIEIFKIPLNTLKNNPNFQNMFTGCSSLTEIGYEIKQSDRWHLIYLNFGSNNVHGKVYENRTSTPVTIPTTSVTKSTLRLPHKTDELLFAPNMSDADMELLIVGNSQADPPVKGVLETHYSWYIKTVIPPTGDNFVLLAKDPDKISTNLSFPADVSHATGVLPVANGGTGQTSLSSVAVGSAGKWTTARDIKIQDSDGTNTGSAVSVDGSENETLKLPSTIKASITGNCSGSSGSCTGNSATATSATRLGSIAIANIRIGSAQARISLSQLMTWLITTKQYIPSGTDCYKVLGVPWDYSGNDILQLSANGVNYELQLAGCLIEFMGNATNYNTGRFRLTIHSSPTNSFTVSSNYEKFPVSTAVTYTCNGSSYTPIWKIDMPIKKANGYWGFQTPKSDGTWIDSDWVRSTTQGILPYQSGNAGSGHNSLGTSTWYWKNAYIDQIYGYLNGNISGNADKVDNYHVSTASGTTKNDSLNSLVPVSKQYFTTTSGYIVYANGLKIQWLRGSFGSSTKSKGFTFPQNFTDSNTYGCSCVIFDSGTGTQYRYGIGNESKSGGTICCTYSANWSYSIVAIGY